MTSDEPIDIRVIRDDAVPPDRLIAMPQSLHLEPGETLTEAVERYVREGRIVVLRNIAP